MSNSEDETTNNTVDDTTNNTEEVENSSDFSDTEQPPSEHGSSIHSQSEQAQSEHSPTEQPPSEHGSSTYSQSDQAQSEHSPSDQVQSEHGSSIHSQSEQEQSEAQTETRYESSDEEEEESTEETINYFKESIKSYLKLEEEIKILEKGVKVRKEKKKQYGETILSFIQSKDISYVKLQGNHQGKQMECQTTVKTSGVSYKKIIDTIVEHYDDPEDARSLISKINSNKVETKQSKLRIGKPGNSKSKARNLNNLINSTATIVEGGTVSEHKEIPNNMAYLYATIHNE